MNSSEEQEVDLIIQDILRAKPNLTREAVERLISDKVREFGEIIRRDAAALMVAKELGVTLSRESAPASLAVLKIRDLASGFRGVDVEGVVVFNSGPKVTSNGKKFFRFALADETGIIWGVVWEEGVEKLYETLQVGSKVRLLKVSIRKYRERNEIYLDKNTSVRVLSTNAIQELLEYLDKYNPGTRLVRIVRLIDRENRRCILGFDSHCNPVVGIAFLGAHLKEGATALLSGCREYTSRGLRVIRCEEASIRTLEPTSEAINNFSCSELGQSELFGIKAEVLGYVLFKKEGGRVFLRLFKQTGLEEVSSLVLSHDAELNILTSELGKTYEIIGVYRSEGILRETPCLDARSLAEVGEARRHVFSKFLVGEESIVNRATVLSLNARIRCYKERPLFHATLLLDDGTATKRGLCNNPRVFEKIFSLPLQEACEYSSGSLDAISSYVGKELQGREVIVKARVIPEHYKYSLIVEDLRLTPYS